MLGKMVGLVWRIDLPLCLSAYFDAVQGKPLGARYGEAPKGHAIGDF